MTQSFSRKKMGLAITTAMAVASPLALANQFAGSALDVQVSTGPNVAVGTAVSLGSQVIQITESPIGTVQNGSKGTIVLTLDNGAKWATGTGTSTALPVNALACSAITYGSGSSNATLTMNCSATATPSTAAVLQLANITLDTSGSTVDTDVKVTLSSASTFPALTTGATAKVATVKSNGFTVSIASAPTVVANSSVTLPTITLTENVPGMFKTAALNADEIKIDLPSGVTFVTSTVVATPDTNVLPAGSPAPSAYTATSTTSSLTFDVSGSAGSTTAAGKITTSGGTYFVPNGQATGDINATVSVKLAGSTTATTTTLKLATVAVTGTTNTFVEATVGGATDYNTLYTGRSYATGFASPLEADGIKVAETAPGALAAGGTVTLTLSTGKYQVVSGAPITATNSGLTGAVSNQGTTATAVATYALTAASSSAGSVTFTFDKALDLSSATTGDLNVTVGGTTNVTTGTIKLATIAKATTSSASGTQNSFTPGGTTASQLQDVVITETNAGALAAGTIGIKLPTTVDYDTTVTPTVTVAQGTTTVTGKVTTPATTHYVNTSGAVANKIFNVALLSASTVTPYTITVSGLKAKASSSAAQGNLQVTVFGSSGAVTAAPSALDEVTYPSANGAMPFSEAVTVGTVGSTTVSTATTTTSGPTSSTTVVTSYAPAGNDLGKQGSIFVAAIIVPGNALYCYGSTNGTGTPGWVAYTTPASCLPYFQGQLAALNNQTLLSSINLTGYKGSTLYIGYGTGGALSPAGTAFNSMLTNGTYSLVFTAP